ncbi:MAG: ABC transporter substrate-binding protein [Pseudomonadota bacterium]
MKQFGLLALSTLALLLATPTFGADTLPPVMKKVLISQVVDHPALNETTQGIIDGLASKGYIIGDNLTLRVESAQANAALATQIASKFIHQQPDVVVGVGTPSAQSFAKAAADHKVRLIFSSVTDPLSAGLVQSLEAPGYDISGVSNFVPLTPQLKYFLDIQPNLNQLGIIYNPGEINSVAIVKQLEALCPPLNITLVKQTVARTADVPQAAVKLAAQVDAIFISNDNTALSSLQSIIKAAQAQAIPVYVSDTGAVSLGAIAALGPNQYDIGLQTGRMIARVLEGDQLSTMPVEFPEKTELYLNVEAADAIGLTIPEILLDAASSIVGSAS